MAHQHDIKPGYYHTYKHHRDDHRPTVAHLIAPCARDNCDLDHVRLVDDEYIRAVIDAAIHAAARRATHDDDYAAIHAAAVEHLRRQRPTA